MSLRCATQYPSIGEELHERIGFLLKALPNLNIHQKFTLLEKCDLNLTHVVFLELILL